MPCVVSGYGVISPLVLICTVQGGSVQVSAGSSSGTRTFGITFRERYRGIASHNGTASVVGVTRTNAAITVNYSGSSSNDRVANFVVVGN